MIKQFSYHALEQGPTLVVLGAVHGNEPCGRFAIEQVADQLDRETLRLSRGRLVMVPVCNPKAYEHNVRFVDRNLNRQLYVKPKPQAYEDRIDPILCGILDQADGLLDLHSYASPGGPFIFLGGDDPKETAYAQALGVNDFVSGWEQAFSSEGQDEQGRLASIGTTEYVRARGGMSVTLECGQHDNADNVAIGVQAILRALQYFNLIEGSEAAEKGNKENKGNVEEPVEEVGKKQAHRTVRMKEVFYKQKKGAFSRPWRHFDPVSAGEVMAEYEDGEQLIASQPGYIVLPKALAPVGGEWFYFGVS